jgi:SPP1 family phage portal protein
MENNSEIIKKQEFKEIERLFTSNKSSSFTADQETAMAQYKVKKHDIFDTNKRPDKTIKKDSGETDANGNPTLVTATVEVARIGLSLQKLIVERRVGFMLSDPVKTSAIFNNDSPSEQEQRMEKLVERIQNDNKMDYRNKELARRMMSELECAELWYFVENKEPDQVLRSKFTMKLKILSPELGDKLYPLFDSTGDMIAFARGYKLREGEKDIDHFDVYTTEFEYKYVNRNDVWQLDPEVITMTLEGAKTINPIPNAVGKIMIIYHSQKQPEWDDVQPLIDRREKLASNHADTNDYFGSPILKIKGEIKGYAQKGESGKTMQVQEEGDADYLSWDSSPESMKDERESLQKDIYSLTQTPDISFERMVEIGGNISGIALKLMFLDAHMAVRNKEEIFGIGLQRRLNLLKAAIGTVIDTSLSGEARTLQMKPVLTPYMPENVTEMIENLSVAKTGGIISTETAVEQNPLVEDKDVEMERLKNDKTDELAGLEDNNNKPPYE